jgi:hypothetical protein
MLSGMAVTAADPSGLIGVLQESMASGRTLIGAKSDPASNELIKAVATEYESAEGRSAASELLRARLRDSKPDEVKDKMIAGLVMSPHCSTAKPQQTLQDSRFGCITSPRMQQRRPTRAASWVLAVSLSAMLKEPHLPSYPARSA